MSTLEFGRRHLAEPLGFSLPAWYRDPQGVYFGGNEMQMTPRAMVSIGQLVLACGMHDGTRVVSEQWVEASLQPDRVQNEADASTAMGGGCAPWPATRPTMPGDTADSSSS